MIRKIINKLCSWEEKAIETPITLEVLKARKEMLQVVEEESAMAEAKKIFNDIIDYLYKNPTSAYYFWHGVAIMTIVSTLCMDYGLRVDGNSSSGIRRISIP